VSEGSEQPTTCLGHQQNSGATQVPCPCPMPTSGLGRPSMTSAGGAPNRRPTRAPAGVRLTRSRTFAAECRGAQHRRMSWLAAPQNVLVGSTAEKWCRRSVRAGYTRPVAGRASSQSSHTHFTSIETVAREGHRGTSVTYDAAKLDEPEAHTQCTRGSPLQVPPPRRQNTLS
jgi:hypothetical protein